MFAIAEGLTRDGIPSPSAHDRARNPHRDTRAWAKSAVRAILTNPRYTGRQVWNRQSKYEVLLDIHDVSLGYTTSMRWNTQEKWIVSKRTAHTPLVDDDTFARVQEVLGTRARTGTAHVVHRTRNPYLFRGRIVCEACTRRMQAQWSHGDAYYRCRFPEQYALANRVPHPRNVYLREKWLTPALDDWLAGVFQPHRLDETIDLMAAAEDPRARAEAAAAEAARARIAECDTKLTRYRAALEAGADPAVVTRWITEVQAERTRAETRLHTAAQDTGTRMTRDDVAAVVRSVSDLAAAVRQATPEDKAELYRRLGLRLAYTPGRQTVRATISPEPDIPPNARTPRSRRDRGEMVRVRGGT
ncbi:recombinase family protein [Streptomyces nanhaiensis]|uniref:recombinase family protein n=1 Tax=Streptomyces nanhaiensis TaxID=679319 RepID=UPI00399CCD23